MVGLGGLGDESLCGGTNACGRCNGPSIEWLDVAFFARGVAGAFDAAVAFVRGEAKGLATISSSDGWPRRWSMTRAADVSITTLAVMTVSSSMVRWRVGRSVHLRWVRLLPMEAALLTKRETASFDTIPDLLYLGSGRGNDRPPSRCSHKNSVAPNTNIATSTPASVGS